MIKEHVIGDQIYICEEKWKIILINGIATKYDVSNLGRVKNSETGNIISGYWAKGKYHTVTLDLGPGGCYRKTHQRVSRLVAIAFIPIPDRYKKMGYTEKDLAVDHIRDGDWDNHLDNSVYNLQWLTSEENYKKAYDKGLIRGTKGKDHFIKISGENHHLAKHTAKDAIKVRDLLYENKLNIKEISEKSNTDVTFVKDILYKHAWRSVIGDCDFSGYTKSRKHKEINKYIDEWLISGESYSDIKSKLISYGYTDTQLIKHLIHNRKYILIKHGKL